jgi:hypothetical protein
MTVEASGSDLVQVVALLAAGWPRVDEETAARAERAVRQPLICKPTLASSLGTG